MNNQIYNIIKTLKMRKISFLALCLAAGFCASAQEAVVKEAERAMKSDQTFEKVVEIITPAFQDPQTASDAKTYYIPGNTAFSQYDKYLALKQLNQADKLPSNPEVVMGNLLIQGYNYFMKAFPLDSVTDAKGKVKTKYSKEMAGKLAGHFFDYTSAGADLFNGKDYKGAYDAWGIFTSLAANPEVAKKVTNMPADTIYGEIYFNQGIAAWQINDLKAALQSFNNARSKGYTKKAVYDYALAVAAADNNKEAVLEVAKEALPLYGKEDNSYMGQIVNYYLQNKDLDKAFEVINQAIASEPDNAQYYVIQGVLYENSEKRAEAKAAYKKAVEIDGQNAQALYNYGRQICEDAYALGDSAPTNPEEYEVYYAEKIKPLFIEASTILEKAFEIDSENSDILKYLENVYYNLRDEEKMEYTKTRLENL